MPRMRTPTVAPQLAPNALAYLPLIGRGIREGVEGRTRRKQWERQQAQTEKVGDAQIRQGDEQIQMGQARLGQAERQFTDELNARLEMFGRDQDFRSSEAIRREEFQGGQNSLSRALSRRISDQQIAAQREGTAASLLAAQARNGGMIDLGGGRMAPFDDVVKMLGTMGDIAGGDFMTPGDLRGAASGHAQFLMPRLMQSFGYGQPAAPAAGGGRSLVGPYRPDLPGRSLRGGRGYSPAKPNPLFPRQ